MSEEGVNLYFLGTFNVIINYIFFENFIEIRHVSQKIYLLQKNLLTLASYR